MPEPLKQGGKPNLNIGQSIGTITTFFSEQLLERDFAITRLEPENIDALVKEQNLKTVFVDGYIYEQDHPWFGYETEEVLSRLSSLDLEIIIIQNTTRTSDMHEGSHFTLNISDENLGIEFKDGILELPPLVNERKFNPIEVKPMYDVAYFKLGKLRRTKAIQEYHVTFKPKRTEVVADRITRAMIEELIEAIRVSRVLYIYHSDDLPDNFLKYLEIIAVLQNTMVVLEPAFDLNEGFAINTQDDESNVNYMRAFSRDGLYVDKNIIGRNRQAFLNYTLMQRKTLPEVLQGDVEKREINVSVITSTKRKWTIAEYIDRLNKQKVVGLQSILLTHGFELSEEEQQEISRKANFDIKIISRSQDVAFGDCLNACIELADYEYFTKIDDDDYYFPNYLIDSWIAQQYSNADIVGKFSQFVYLEGENLTIQRFTPQKYRYVQYIAGATIFCKTSFMKQYMFSPLPKAVDSDLLRRVNADGGTIYCGHPYEFCIFRAGDKSEHTWQAPDLNLLRSSKILSYSEPTATLTVNF